MGQQRQRLKGQSRSTKKRADNKAFLGNLTYLDMFPYNPSYEYRGFRSAFGAICSLAFAFAVLLNLCSKIIEYRTDPPYVMETQLKISDFTDAQTIKLPTLGIEFRKNGFESFYDQRYFRIRFLQASAVRNSIPALQDAGIQDCSIDDTDGFLTYANLKCPISDMSLQGSDNLEYFRFVKVLVEQCVNWTEWNVDRYVPAYGSTTDDQSLCADADDIDTVLKNGIFTLYLRESDMRTDRQTYFSFDWISRIRSTVLSAGFLTKTLVMRLKHLKAQHRFVLDKPKLNTEFLTVFRERDAITDTEETVVACNPVDDCDRRPHLYRMQYIIRLDDLYLKQIRINPRLYEMFTNFGGVTFFFLMTIGGTAMLVNKKIFQRQTQGLDLRKLDNSQFDKFGNLVDKSFQMPRELQDMSAE